MIEMTVRAKFVCNAKTEHAGGNGKVELLPVINGNDENKEFWKYTPSGKIEMQIDNPAAFGKFEVGKEYYVDFINPTEVKTVVVDAYTTSTIKPSLTEQDLIFLLGKNNEQLKVAIEKQDKARKGECPVDIEDTARSVGWESGEALMLVKLIKYLRGEKKLDEIA
jgi:hypothetical protein